jgi:glycosyltransferase involved in cell wall biosynthesis
MALKIIYTHDAFGLQDYGGISRYLIEVIKRIPPGAAEVQIFAGLHINKYLGELPGVIGIKTPVFPRKGWVRIVLNALMQISRRGLNNLAQRVILRSDEQTIIHLSYYTRPPAKRKAKLVVTIYDMIHELFPQYFPWYDRTMYLKKLCCKEADKIIAISNCTKNDLVRLFGINPTKIEVIYLGNSLEHIALMRPSSDFNKPYLLYVGARRGYKNFSCLVEAFARSQRLRNHFALVCFGGGPFSSWERMEWNKVGISHQIYYVEGDDALFASYYKNARALVCPSLYEGFGLPLVEAMGLGCPVICSDRGAIPEVAGDAGIYFDPTDTDQIGAVLETALFDDSILKEKTERGRRRAAMFNWDHTANETLALYRSLVQGLD